jgi:thiamine biosynthesis protein ThiS
VRSELTVAELLEELELRPEQVAVELNQRLVARRLRAETRLSEGDQVELVTLVGGG